MGVMVLLHRCAEGPSKKESSIDSSFDNYYIILDVKRNRLHADLLIP